MKKILIIKIGAIGDVIMSLPLLSFLHANESSQHLTWICGKAAAPLVEATRRVDRLIVVDEAKLLAGSFIDRARSLVSIWKQIGGERFDQMFLLHADFRYRAIGLPIFCKDKRHWGKAGKRNYPIPGRYHAHEAIRLAASELGPQDFEAPFPPLVLPASPYLKDFADKPLIVLSPGGAKNVLADDALRRWPIAHFAELIRKLSNYNCHIAVIGSESDNWILPHLQDLPVHRLLGRMKLLECLSFLKEASLFITHDSGPLHMAKLAQCPTIALFGPTNPCEKIGAGENIEVLWGGSHLNCRPCYAGKSYAACSDNRCLGDLKPDQVLDAAVRILKWDYVRT